MSVSINQHRTADKHHVGSVREHIVGGKTIAPLSTGCRFPRQTDDRSREQHGVFPTKSTDNTQCTHDKFTVCVSNRDRFGRALRPGEVERRVARDGPAGGVAGRGGETTRRHCPSLLVLLTIDDTALVALGAVPTEQQRSNVLVDFQL